MRLRRFFSLLLLFLPLTALGQDDPVFSVTRRTLPNGLQIWVKPRQGTRSVEVRVVVKVGFRHESVEDSGISHLLEHMLFKGTKQHTEIELKRMLDAKGAYHNGVTDIESTHYYVNIRDEHHDFAVDWLREILRESLLQPVHLEQARKDVYSEQQGHYSAFIEKIFAAGFFQPLEVRIPELAFPQAEIPERIVWSVDHVDSAMLRGYLERFYVPNNMAVIVVGNVEPAHVIEKITQSLGDLPTRPVDMKHYLSLQSPRVPGAEITTRLMPPAGEMTSIVRGIWTGGRKDPDRYSLMVIAEHLSNRLYEEVRSKRALARDVWAQSYMLTDLGVLWAEVHPQRDRDDEARVREIIEQVIGDMTSRPLTPAELNEAKEAILGQMAIRYEDNHELAELYQRLFLVTGPDDPVPDYFAGIGNVTSDEVLRVARERFSEGRIFAGAARPPLSYTQAVVGILIAAGIGLVIVIQLIRGLRRRRKAIPLPSREREIQNIQA